MLFGGSGRDYVNGNNGNDRCYGGDDRDHVYGGLGADIVRGDAGDDYICGNVNWDRTNLEDWPLDYTGGDDIRGGEGRDRIWGTMGDDTLGASNQMIGNPVFEFQYSGECFFLPGGFHSNPRFSILPFRNLILNQARLPIPPHRRSTPSILVENLKTGKRER